MESFWGLQITNEGDQISGVVSETNATSLVPLGENESNMVLPAL